MATKSNPFSSLLGGLGVKAPSSFTATASTPKSSFISNYLRNTPATGNMSRVNTGASSPMMSVAPTFSTTSPKPVIKANSTPVPVSPMQPKPGYNMTNAATGLPAVGGAGAMSTPVPRSSTNMSTPSSAREQFTTQSVKSAVPQQQPATSMFFGDTSATSPTSTDVGGFDTGAPSSTGSGGGASFGGSVSAPAGTGGDYRSQYLSMLGGIYSTDELKSSTDELQKLRERMADTQLEQREQEEYIRENKAGALARGVNAQVAENNRTSSKELADLAIAASPYESYLNNAMSAYKTAAEYENEGNDPFTLSEGQVRYDAKGNRIAGSSAPAATSASDPIVQAWAKGVASKQFDISNVPESIRSAVAQAVSNTPTSQNPEVQQAVQKAALMLGPSGSGGLIDNAISQINGLTSGFIGKSSEGIAGTPAYNLARAIDTIKANLGFQELAAMRAASPTGGALGQVTEKELNFLQSTVASLDQGQDERTLKANLQKVKEHYNNWLNAVQQAAGSSGGSMGSSVFAEQW